MRSEVEGGDNGNHGLVVLVDQLQRGGVVKVCNASGGRGSGGGGVEVVMICCSQFLKDLSEQQDKLDPQGKRMARCMTKEKKRGRSFFLFFLLETKHILVMKRSTREG